MFPSIWQILIVLLIVVLLFGAGKLPKVAEDLAKSIKAFRKGMNDDNDGKDARKKDDKEEK